ncbi:MAG TPA: two-component regulator propeller domain-containing protein, partial [Verrucomicrobiae bacterium]
MTSPVCLLLHILLSSRRARFFAVLMVIVYSRTTSLIAADYLINVWSSEDGLPQNSVNCLAQTPDGYLWVGTRSGGLARFDGDRFVTFNPQTTPELKDVEIEALSADSYGTLWITAGNESIASLTRGKFRLVREPNAEPRWHPLQIQTVAEDANAVYLAAYDECIYRIPRNGGVNEAQRIELNPPSPNPPTGQFIQARDGALWYITASHQVAQMQFAAPTNVRFNVFGSHTPATALTRDQAGQIWVAAGNRLGVMTPEGFVDHTPTNGPAPDGVRQMIPTKDGGLWIWDGDTLRKMAGGQWTVT